MSKAVPLFRTTNWSSYGQALKRRGLLLVWLDLQMSWSAAPSGKAGHPERFSAAAIQFCLSIKVLFGLPLRQTTGFVETRISPLGHVNKWRSHSLMQATSFCARRMMMGADHCAIDHLELVRRNPSVVQRIQDVLPQPREGPAAELAVDRRSLAELLREIPPRRAGSRDPENSIQNKMMIGALALIRMPDRTDDPLEEGRLVVGYQIARQDQLPSRDDLESQGDEHWKPGCQHALDGKIMEGAACRNDKAETRQREMARGNSNCWTRMAVPCNQGHLFYLMEESPCDPVAPTPSP